MLALMISRLISYYICMSLSGIVTFTYHMAAMKKPALQEEAAEPPPSELAAEEQPTEGNPQQPYEEQAEETDRENPREENLVTDEDAENA